MVNGRLFEAETMNQIGNTEQARSLFWWQFAKSDKYFIPTGNIETHTFTVPECD
jgi:hypothetical protein